MSSQDMKGSAANQFKLGLFAFNCSGGLTMTKAPERWDPSWSNNLAAAALAEDAGFEFLLPIARWHGYGGDTDAEGESFETITWATGLLAATRRVEVFGTVHVALINPIFAAKQIVTADHIGGGRFGLNIVSGWNQSEFEMFGVVLREHDERYDYSEEWITIVRKVWSDIEPFDFSGRFFSLKNVRGSPKPPGRARPTLMSAGSSPAGRAFAIRNADYLFMGVLNLDSLPGDVEKIRALSSGNPFGLYTGCFVLCRPTEKEAQDYYRYIVHDMGDWNAAELIVASRARGARSIAPERILQMKERHVAGQGSFPIVGSYDQVAETLSRMSAAGLDGAAIGFVNYKDELPGFRDGVLPRLERLGLRRPMSEHAGR